MHRDVKPSNFLVAGAIDELHVVLADFGGVKRIAFDSSLSIATGVHTPGCAPPDQVLPRKVPADRSWDA